MINAEIKIKTVVFLHYRINGCRFNMGVLIEEWGMSTVPVSLTGAGKRKGDAEASPLSHLIRNSNSIKLFYNEVWFTITFYH